MADTTASPPLSPTGPAGPVGGGSGGTEIQQQGTTGPGGTTTTQRRRAAGLAPQRGRREMREYPLTDSDLHDLRNIGVGTVISFSVGSVLLGIWSNIITSMAFVPDAPKELVAVWADRERFAFLGAMAAYAVGVILILVGYTRVDQIKSEVEFPDGSRFRRRRWVLVAAILIAAGLLVGGGYWLGKNT
jgi:hypothetical protein